MPDAQIAALRQLRNRASGPTDASFVDGFPRLVETSVAMAGETPAQRAKAFLVRYRELYGQFMAQPFRRARFDPNQLPDADPDTRFGDFRRTLKGHQGKPTSTPDLDLAVRGTSGPGDQVIAFTQTYKGLPVFGADLLVFVEGSRVKATVGGLLSDLDLGVRPTLEIEEAQDAARRELELGGPDTAPALASTHLVVFAPLLLPDSSRTIDPEPHLAWQVALGGPEPTQALVDAHDGELLVDSPGIRGHNGLDDYDLDLETANGNTASNSGCYWGTSDDDTLGDEDGLNSDGQSDPEAVALFGFAKSAYKFFHGKFGRHSYDGDGGQFELYVHAGVDNASWIAGSVDCDLIDFASGWAQYDVLIHELTHALGDFSLFGGPTYQNQTGALDESHADTLAARADGNWDIGEAVPGGPIRDMSNPPGDMNQFGHPDRMSEFVETSSDSGGVHTNSGIPNKAAFLIADGGTHPDTGVQVNGIGKAALGWLTYNTISVMPTNASFMDNRGLMLVFADAAYSNQTTCQVRNAYFAVELGWPDIGCDGDEDNPDADNDGTPFGQDNCPFDANPSQKDTDGDGKGDVCDGDADEDGVFWPQDNCPNIANPDQTDANFNGIGKLCDPTEDEDFDDDGVLNEDDNCILDANSGQEDVDADGDGDACDPDADGDGWSNDDDNAPFEPNPGQEDSDRDGIGDVSDDCPNTKDQNVAWTAGNADLGIDPVPLQPDSDGDGTPDACDPSVLVGGRVTSAKNFLRPDGDARRVEVDGERGAYVKVPVSPSAAAGFDGFFRQGERRLVSLTGVDPLVKTWISDQDGRTVARPHPRAGTRRTLRFSPLAGHRYFLFLYFSDPFPPQGSEAFDTRMTAQTIPVRWPEPPPIRAR